MNRLNMYATIALVCLSLTGCFHATELGQLRREIDREMPQVEFEREIEMSLGPMSLGFARLVTFFVPPAWQIRGMLSEIHAVKVGVYRANRHASLKDVPTLRLPPQLQNLLADKDWELAIKARDGGEMVWLLYHIQGQTVDQVHLVALADEELVLVRFDGHLERLLARALEHPQALEHPGDLAHYRTLEASGFANWQGHWQSGSEDLRAWRQEGLVAQYNKVDGLYLGWRPRSHFHRTPRLQQYGELGFGVGGDHWRYQLGAEWLAVGKDKGAYTASLGAELHELTDTQDHWLLSTEENSLDAVLFRRDFRDYYRRSGFSAYLTQRLGHDLRLTARYTQDDFAQLKNGVEWSLFGRLGRDDFRANDAIDEDQINSVQAELSWDSRDSRQSPRRGWFVNGLAERAGDTWGGDRRFNRYVLDMRRYQPVTQGSRLDFRLRAGRASGAVPLQYQFDLGGFASLRGYRFKEFSGDRMVLLNAEYWLAGSRDHQLGPFEGINVGFFVDAGSAWIDAEADMDLHASGGLGLHFEDFRLFIARPFQGQERQTQTSLRFSRSF
ncbi:MAG: BamA/TamA family outer membrane protein [Candidatus Latescibacteria bacterium]|nr:BamA/TamA family outer membrane protein [Candidatus Latescibacterota bacterium]